MSKWQLNPRILFLSKQTEFCQYAIDILHKAFLPNELVVITGEVGDSFDEDLLKLKPDYIISFLSPWIIPAKMLTRAKVAAINFHPGSTEYPGIGCYNFAIYDGAKEYGVVAHHMEPQVDSGKIIQEKRFLLYQNDTVATLKLKSMLALLSLFQEILDLIVLQKPLPVATVTWQRKPYTRREMNALFKINLQTMPVDEIQRRVKAATYPPFRGAHIEVGDMVFKFDDYAQSKV